MKFKVTTEVTLVSRSKFLSFSSDKIFRDNNYKYIKNNHLFKGGDPTSSKYTSSLLYNMNSLSKEVLKETNVSKHSSFITAYEYDSP